jgi:ferredoxin
MRPLCSPLSLRRHLPGKKEKGVPPSIPVIDPALCRGCGLCATGCYQEAIGMQKIRESVLESYYT